MENTTTPRSSMKLTIGTQTLEIRASAKALKALATQWNAGDPSARFALGHYARKQGLTLTTTDTATVA